MFGKKGLLGIFSFLNFNKKNKSENQDDINKDFKEGAISDDDLGNVAGGFGTYDYIKKDNMN